MTPVRLAVVSRDNRGIGLDVCRQLARLAARFSLIDRGVSDRGALRLGRPLISQGGSQGIGDQSYFPGGLLTTAQPVGYHKPITDGNLRLTTVR
jgi:hypothetical protein